MTAYSESGAFKVIPNEQISDVLFKAFGKYSVGYDTNLFTIMRHLVGPAYQGGMWELREYPNGALALVFPEADTRVDVTPFNQNYVCCTLEAASYAANLIVLSNLCIHAFDNEDDLGNTTLHDYYHALIDSLRGIMNFVVVAGEPGCREPTDEDLVNAALTVKHPELLSIADIID